MRQMFFDVWPADDPNGTALGELTEAYGKQYTHAHQAMGSGQFTINRHDAQAAWAATDNFVRVRRVTGGPFDANDARYIGGFWIESGDDILLDGSKEEGGEELTRAGRTGEACLRWAILYPDAHDSRNDQFTTHTRKTGNWIIKDRTAGEVLSIVLRDLDDRSPDPLPFVSKDFGVALDSIDEAWSDADTKWELPVGQSLLDVLATCVSGDLFYRVSPSFVFSAFEDEPGDDLSGSITIAKGDVIAELAERQIYGKQTVSRVVVQGTKENGDLKYREVINTNLEPGGANELPQRREGFVEFRRTPTNNKLDKAGRRFIRKHKGRHDGVPTVKVVEIEGQEAFIDYEPGDVLDLDVDGLFGNYRVYSITLEEDDKGEVDPILEFEQSPFDPFDNRDGELTDNGGGKPSCNDCPPIPPFVPCENGGEVGATGGITLYSPDDDSEVGATTFPIVWLDTGDAPGAGQPSRPGDLTNFAYVAGSPGQYDGIEVLASSGTIDLHLLFSFINVASGTMTYTARIKKNGVQIASQATVKSGGLRADTHTFSLFANDVPAVAGDVFSADFTSSVLANPTVPWGAGDVFLFRVLDTSTVSVEEPIPCEPLEGQTHAEETAGDGSTVEFQTNYPYAPNSLHVFVDGLLWPVTETDPTTGTFTFDSAPPDGAVIIIHYQNAGTEPTGATNTVPEASTPSGGGVHAHAAEDVTVADVGGYFTGTDVEAVLQEIGAGGFGHDTTYNEVAASGATETLDIALARAHDVTLTADCTLTFSGPVNDEFWLFTMILREDGTGGWTPTWPGSVQWPGGTPTLDETAGAVHFLTFLTVDGGTTWYGFVTGGGSSVAALDDLSDATITAPAEDDTLRYIGGEWVNDNRRWEPVTYDFGSGPEPVYDDGEMVMHWREY